MLSMALVLSMTHDCKVICWKKTPRIFSLIRTYLLLPLINKTTTDDLLHWAKKGDRYIFGLKFFFVLLFNLSEHKRIILSRLLIT